MKINFFRNLNHNTSDKGKVQNFINELENCLENNVSEIPLFKQIESERNISKIYGNTIKRQMKEILTNYAKEDNCDIYFVHNKITDSLYNVYKYGIEETDTIQISADRLPVGANVNSVLKFENGKYVLDKEATSKLEQEIKEYANKILDEQDQELEKFREENHLYRVEENRKDRVYLLNLGDKGKGVVEEVKFPKDLIPLADEGAVFIYKDGEYKYHTSDGFEKIYE